MNKYYYNGSPEESLEQALKDNNYDIVLKISNTYPSEASKAYKYYFNQKNIKLMKEIEKNFNNINFGWALIQAIKSNHFDIVKMIIENKAQKLYIYHLEYACRFADVKIIYYLLEKSITPNTLCLINAVLAENNEIIELLIKKGVDNTILSVKKNMELYKLSTSEIELIRKHLL